MDQNHLVGPVPNGFQSINSDACYIDDGMKANVPYDNRVMNCPTICCSNANNTDATANQIYFDRYLASITSTQAFSQFSTKTAQFFNSTSSTQTMTLFSSTIVTQTNKTESFTTSSNWTTIYIVIGVVAAVLIVLTVAFFVLKAKKRRNREIATTKQSNNSEYGRVELNNYGQTSFANIE